MEVGVGNTSSLEDGFVIVAVCDVVAGGTLIPCKIEQPTTTCFYIASRPSLSSIRRLERNPSWCWEEKFNFLSGLKSS